MSPKQYNGLPFRQRFNRSLARWLRLLRPAHATLLLTLLVVFPDTLQAAPSGNYLAVDGKTTQPLVVSGVIEVRGVADHEDFRKWQIDLLLDGITETFLAWGEDPESEEAFLAAVDTTRYPDGEHLLRLRVVHTHMNYDEYTLAVTFANQPQGTAPSTAVVTATVTVTSSATPTVTPTQTATFAEKATEDSTETPTPTPSATTSPTTAESPTETPRPWSPNGLFVVNAKPIRGLLTAEGVAVHPTFRKWQIDLLINGDQTRDTFIALGEEQVTARALLAEVDTARYPNGVHVLRLRVVHSNMNYDEYITQVIFDNPLNVVATSAPSPNVDGKPVYRGGNGDAVLYLTYDDGPSGDTQSILDALARYNARATFFVLGNAAQARPALVRRIHEAGHGVGNHSWNHRRLTGMSEESFNEDILATASAIGPYAAACLRPPYGATDPSTYAHATALGYPIVLWSIDPTDWRRPGAQAIANHVIARAFPGAIVVLHDGGGDRSQTAAATEIILRELSARGYRFEAYCR
ncbi:polysaccharide deacetylase family protein [bacterium]|nr:polysaccharide deacetylase family protein [bacterium]